MENRHISIMCDSRVIISVVKCLNFSLPLFFLQWKGSGWCFLFGSYLLISHSFISLQLIRTFTSVSYCLLVAFHSSICNWLLFSLSIHSYRKDKYVWPAHWHNLSLTIVLFWCFFLSLLVFYYSFSFFFHKCCSQS